MNKLLLSFFIGLVMLTGCLDQDVNPGTTISGDWSIPINQVFDGGPGRDGIPAIDQPDFINANTSQSVFLGNDELVIGYYDGENAVAYPHQILDWHEIVNDKVNELAFAVTYCPLTGTAIGWNRLINGNETTFGVSGLLYNTNLIPFDRTTKSNWSQMLLSSVNGELQGNVIEYVPLVETTWKTWRDMYPDTQVLSRNTGHDRDYGRYPYGDYRTNNNNLLFPIANDDRRLDRKERVHGVIINGKAKAYRFEDFPELRLVKDEFESKDLIVVGDRSRNFIVSFYAPEFLSQSLELNVVNTDGIILEDNDGGQWNIFGEAVSGPRQGEKLVNTVSFIGYWFAWGAFYPNLEIYNFQ